MWVSYVSLYLHLCGSMFVGVRVWIWSWTMIILDSVPLLLWGCQRQRQDERPQRENRRGRVSVCAHVCVWIQEAHIYMVKVHFGSLKWGVSVSYENTLRKGQLTVCMCVFVGARERKRITEQEKEMKPLITSLSQSPSSPSHPPFIPLLPLSISRRQDFFHYLSHSSRMMGLGDSSPHKFDNESLH